MTRLKSNRRARLGLLPTTLLALSLSVSGATVGQADPITPSITVTAPAVQHAGAKDLRAEIRATADNAALLTSANVSIDLRNRLQGQQRPLRLASRNVGDRG